jgi:L-ascorbate metabolism protein UlaG (beta-lactamase superfamily)
MPTAQDRRGSFGLALHSIFAGHRWMVPDHQEPHETHPIVLDRPSQRRDDPDVAADPDVQVTWWGHSSVTVQWAGQRLLFDPVLRDSVAHLRRRRGPTPAMSARSADAVLISHLHPDHCDVPSLRLLAPGTLVIGPAGIAGFLRRSLGSSRLRCQEMVDADETMVGNLAVRALWADHHDRRSPVSRFRAQPLSFLITEIGAGGQSLWFGGDTGLHDGIGTVAPVSVALVPVAGWGPRLGPGHLDSEQAAEAVSLLSARAAIPIHYGTLWPRGLGWLANDQFLGPEDRFEASAQHVCPQTSVHILSPGETFIRQD